jgi:predicted nucleotidyltransferase
MPVQPEQSIIKALAYFDIFNYPLTQEEITSFLDQPVAMQDVSEALQQLVAGKRVFRLGNFYSLQYDHTLLSRRTAGNYKAEALLTIAYKIGGFLYQFPFVRGIGISGSLSKNFADQQSDIDFFIITRTNRLWVARTLMHLFKKLTFITGHQHLYCMNYYIDEEAMRIDEQNIFTATELITLLPVCGNGTMDRFYDQNNWAADYFPNQKMHKQSLFLTRSTWFKRAVEWLLENRLGNALDNVLMRITSRRWMKKEQQQRTNAHGNRMGLHTGKHFSKPNPEYFQRKVLESLEKRLVEMDWAFVEDKF